MLGADEKGRRGEGQTGPRRSRNKLELSLELAAGPAAAAALPLLLADTEVLGDALAALLAPHGAAPVELAVAAGHHLSSPLLHRQPAVPTQPPAAPLLPLVECLAPLQALPALRAQQPQRLVLQAVVRRVFQMDQLLLGDGAEGLGDGTPAGSAVPCALQQVHLQGFVVPFLEVSAHLSKLRQLQPAGLGGAAPRHTMAFASPLHGPFHSLRDEEREGIQEKAQRGHFIQ